MTGFYGQFEYQMDEKGRVALPSAYRREAQGDRFVLLQWESPYLSLYPEAAWKEKQAALVELRRSGDEGTRFVRKLLSMATEVIPDKQGRILIPSLLQNVAGLDGRVLFIGNSDYVELWNPDRYRGTEPDEMSEVLYKNLKKVLG